MGHRPVTRRQLLRRGSGALGSVALVGTAGCTGRLPNPTGSGRPDYTRWMPATLQEVSPPVRFTAENYSSFAADRDELDDDLLERLDELERHWKPADVPWEDVTMALKFNGAVVVQAEFERDEVLEDYAAENFETEDQHGGFAVLLGPEGKLAAAVGDDTLVTWWGTDSVAVVENIVDAGNGDSERYADASEDFDELTGALGDGDYIDGETMEKTTTHDPEDGHFGNVVARGESWRIDGATTDGRWVLVFEGDGADTDDLRDWFESREQNDGWSVYGEWEDPRYSRDGRLGIVEATIDTSEL